MHTSAGQSPTTERATGGELASASVLRHKKKGASKSAPFL
jgi:hypothetical protein